jgi:hypothetical protein
MHSKFQWQVGRQAAWERMLKKNPSTIVIPANAGIYEQSGHDSVDPCIRRDDTTRGCLSEQECFFLLAPKLPACHNAFQISMASGQAGCLGAHVKNGDVLKLGLGNE